MIIRKLRGFFGVLNNKELDLKPGLNIIMLKNEGGKTTWSNFIRLMFYGIDTSKRDKKNVLADKTKYKPLTDKPMSGFMEIELEDKNLIIQRGSGKAGVFSSFDCFDKETGAKTFSDNTFADEILGITENEFINCAFIDGVDMNILSSAVFEEKILALSSTGDNTMGTINALEKLDRMRLDIRVNSSKGYLPEAQKQLKIVNDNIISYQNIKNELNKLDILKIKEEIEKKQRDKEKLLVQNKKSDDEIALQNLENELKTLLKPVQPDMNIIEKYMRANEGLLEKTREYEKKLEMYNNEQKNKDKFIQILLKKKKIYILLDIIFVVLAIISAIYSQIIVAGLLMLSALITALIIPKNSFIEKHEKPSESYLKAARDLEKEIKDEIFSMSAEKKDISLAIIEMKNMQKDAWEYNLKIKTRNDLLDAIKRNKSQVNTESNIENLNVEIKNLSVQYENMFKYKNSLEEKINTLGELKDLSTQKSEIEQNIKKLETTLKAIELGAEVIKAANEQLSAKMAPEISRLCSEYFGKITGGAHSKVILRDSLEPFSAKDTGLLDTLRMSTGTREQLYLALRLCICKLLISNNVPLVLDDPFMSFDNERIKNTMQLLKEIALDRQIILFTAKDIGETIC